MKHGVTLLALGLALSLAGCSTRTAIPAHDDARMEFCQRTTLSADEAAVIRAATPVDPRFVAAAEWRESLGLRRHDKRYEVVTRRRGNAPTASSVRRTRTVYTITTCDTTYLNVSGTYDTSTDPIVAQTCSVTTVSDDVGPLDGGGGGDGSTDSGLVNYGEPWSNFDTTTEQACKSGKTKFISLSKNFSPDVRGPLSPGQTKCGPNNTSGELALTGGVLYPYPGDCNFVVILGATDIEVEYPGGEKPSRGDSVHDGIRINADCSFDFVTR